MPRKPDLPCADCGGLMWSSATTLPVGLARCQPCRRKNPARPARVLFEPRDCTTCGATFTPRIGKQQVCSRPCHVRRRPPRHCETCAKSFSPNVDGQRRCSRTCNPPKTRVRWVLCPLRLHYFTVQGGQRCACQRAEKVTRPTTLTCIGCTEQYERTNHDGTSVRCSTCRIIHDAEQRRLGKDRRRARKTAAYVADVRRADIYQRDGYRCQLCRKKLRMSAQAPHPLAPVLDHIIPLARGGTHEPSNVQAAHFLCNSVKGDRGGGEQLLLIG